MEMRAKIAEIINEWLLGLNLHPDTADRIADQILALPLDDFEVVRECLCLIEKKKVGGQFPWKECPKCNGIGTIIRPLTMKDVDISKLINDVTNLNEQQLGLYTNKLHYLYNPLSLQTPDGGRVRRRGNK